MPISSFFSNIGNQARRFAGQALGRTQQSYKQLDEQLGGWLPGGGTASPFTRAKQQGEMQMANRITKQQEQYVGQHGRFADKGQLINAIMATTQANANPLGILFGNRSDVQKVSNYYKQYPDIQNEYDLNTNMFLRYLSGTGADNLKIPQEVGKQIYTDIRQRAKQLSDPIFKENMLAATPFTWGRNKINSGEVPIYYGGMKDSPNIENSRVLPVDVGQRWQIQNSLGSFWATPTKDGYNVNKERYNFVYAPTAKEGEDFPYGSKVSAAPVTTADVGRNLVRQGFGTPYSYSLNIKPSGEVVAQPVDRR